MKLSTIAYVCLYVSDISESIKFYRDVLGLEPTTPQEDISSTSFYSFHTGTTLLALERNGVKKKGMKTLAENPVLFQFKVESKEQMEEMNTVLEENGVQLYDRSKQTEYGLITNFCDSDGNKLEILYQG